MTAYIVLVTTTDNVPRVSQHGYRTIEDAESFIKSRSFSPLQKTSHTWEDGSRIKYTICEVKV